MDMIPKKMTTTAEDVNTATKAIQDAAAETSSIAEEVRNAHEGLTNTIVDVSEKTTDIYKKIENGQEELDSYPGFIQRCNLRIHRNEEEYGCIDGCYQSYE